MGSIPVGVTKQPKSNTKVERKSLFYFIYFKQGGKSSKKNLLKTMEEEKENNKIIRKKVFENLIIAIAIMLYFILINFSYLRMEENILEKILKTASLATLMLSIIIFEIAYHKDSGKIAIHGIEILILSFITLTIWQVINKTNLSFDTYILFSNYTFAIYYTFKAILIYTNEKRKYLKSLSDIHEIVSKDPIKKEAKKRENK